MKTLLNKTIPIILYSVILIPMGSVSSDNSMMLVAWENLKLKWLFIFGIVGLCVSALYDIGSSLLDFLSEEE